MLAAVFAAAPRQVSGADVQVLGEALRDPVNLAIWQRRLAPHVATFAEQLLAQGEPLAQSLSLRLPSAEAEPDLSGLLAGYSDMPGQAAFLADVAWLVRAYACLLDARSIGLRLRALDNAMCPRFHVDQVPLRLITSYAGSGSQWLPGSLATARADAVPEQIACGHVALLKGERWTGNEGRGLVHRSPPLAAGERRLLLTLDWLA
ncbi:DUF1826 domain-containing protein [Phytopseudomonas dryadis]|uniref:DUF1826 domain-containing protein n=1 Tax=Phytopseudomonas dryadis TaxID=2487520 RepID=A0A4Q9R080_9GAMM|nr:MULTISPECIES: DUF1826 domain-containing protein [Pseudomonas]TBU92041.1 DUF1826 domain-containing protein [Pseudomonas dryadis]TBV04381.1 DUF1826 domain-containing protein [Pseudomonas dryadis]TBV17107.1 DUF1826 domain-containing protein [Pseudomonas sp. FRB 230]